MFTYLSGFSGIYRSVRVEAAPKVHIKEVHVLGKIDPPSAKLSFTLAADAKSPLRARCNITGLGNQTKYSGAVEIAPGGQSGGKHSVTISMPEALLWSPKSPNLYRATITLFDNDKVLDTATVQFGLREIRCEDLRIMLNGKPVFLRGGCDDHVYPETVCPPASKEFYLRRLKLAKKYGFNYTKSCMEVFTPEFLDAADEVGIMVCQEMPFGLTGKYRSVIRENMPEEYVDLYRRQFANIVRSDRNHPSVITYAMISEFSINGLKENTYNLICRELPTISRRLNPNALVMDITCSNNWTGKTKRGPRLTDLIEECAGKQTRQEPLSHPIGGEYEALDRPFLIHEYAWWASLPEMSLKSRYDNLPCKLNGVPEMEASAAHAGVAEQLPMFVDNSRKLKRLLHKIRLGVDPAECENLGLSLFPHPRYFLVPGRAYSTSSTKNHRILAAMSSGCTTMIRFYF